MKKTPLSQTPQINATRRHILQGLAGSALLSLSGLSAAQQQSETAANPRYPDPAVEVLDPSFAKYRLYSASVERLGTGMRWAEGPAWFGDGQFLLVSDIPNNRIMRYDCITRQMAVFREPSNYTNGIARDKQGRILTCEHLGRRVTRTEYDGSITVLADRYNGKPLNSPNDIIVRSDGSIWFTDPPFGLNGHYEGQKATAEQPDGVYRIEPDTGNLVRVLDNLLMPNGLAFSPDEKYLYIIGRYKNTPKQRHLFRYDVGVDGSLRNQTKIFSGNPNGTLDGIAVDEDGNIWAGYGSQTNSKGSLSKDMDGVIIINPQGKQIGYIHLPERCANLCFGGAKGNRLFMASSRSLYAIYVETRGADFAHKK
ncbi:SMP-30/gluconolactonase/LRE family protein [Neisseria perflava]|uniref:SMP-30/gluconolactonase/LRE family protein n=1 Tax=Neisseria perflava TaxID=33053 RepID=UPI0020A1CCB1|nr:gluconolactonase [Neisseria perflava]